MDNMENLTITDIENLKEEDVMLNARCGINYKGYRIYFIDLKGYFGYSMLVYKNGRHIHYANDYELHHSYMKKKSDLYKWYRQIIPYRLFEDKDLEEVKDYTDFENKREWLQNRRPQEYYYISAFVIKGSKDEVDLEERVKKENLIYDPTHFSYVKDIKIVEENIKLRNKLQTAYGDMLNDIKKLKSAILYEMYNHEYAINWEGDYEVMSIFFKNVKYDDLENAKSKSEYLKSIGCNEEQIKAYMEARRECLAKSEI